jgi:hypothetical protein
VSQKENILLYTTENKRIIGVLTGFECEGFSKIASIARFLNKKKHKASVA